MVVDTNRHDLPAGAWAALEGAFNAMIAGGLPCGAALVDAAGTVIARGRNHAYDVTNGADVLEGTPLAHAELNVLAKVATARDLANDTMWGTQQPCAMCAAALSFCGVGNVRFLAADPAFIASGDARGGTRLDPTHDDPHLTAWAILANAMFLQPSLARGDESRLARNRRAEPETVRAAIALARATPCDHLDDLVEVMWNELVARADERRERLRP